MRNTPRPKEPLTACRQVSIDTLFYDCYDVALIDNGVYWSGDLMDRFKATKGYDLTCYLPAIWREVGEISPRIRYEVNEFLHQVGMRRMRGQVLEFSGAATEGPNTLKVEVTNTPINRGSGLKTLPRVPEDLRSRLGGDLGVRTSAPQALIGYKPLPNSGLLGQVSIRPSKTMQASVQRGN